MISLIIKSYLSILLSVGISSLFVFVLGLYFIFRIPGRNKAIPHSYTRNTIAKKAVVLAPSPAMEDNNFADFTSIAGDDILSTQLDLARAYIETGKSQLAKKILLSVQAQGNTIQQQEAQQLLSTI
jgi:FimV-like protein